MQLFSCQMLSFQTNKSNTHFIIGKGFKKFLFSYFFFHFLLVGIFQTYFFCVCIFFGGVTSFNFFFWKLSFISKSYLSKISWSSRLSLHVWLGWSDPGRSSLNPSLSILLFLIEIKFDVPGDKRPELTVKALTWCSRLKYIL